MTIESGFSSFPANAETFAGVTQQAYRIHALDLAWITNSEDAMVLRPGTAPPLRGTFMTLGAGDLTTLPDELLA